MTRGYLRGHVIIWNENLRQWFYEDGLPLPSAGGEVRPCMRCGALFADDAPDACLGMLPGIDNACCGHGMRENAYVRFLNGITIRAFEIEEENNESTQERT